MWIRVACFQSFNGKARLVFLNWIPYIAIEPDYLQ